MAANNLRFSRILRKYDFLIQELEDVSELQGEATREFMRDVAIAKSGGDDKDIEPIVIPDEEETSEEKVELPKEYKKLFRKIVIETHPDKQREGLSNAEKAKEACGEIEKEINGIQSTSAWYYMYVLKTEKERELFIKNFLKLTDDLDENLLENEE